MITLGTASAAKKARRRRCVWLGSCLLLGGFLLASCQSSPDPSQNHGPVKIAVSSPLSTPAGIQVHQGAKLALEHNDHRAGRHRVELLFLDSNLKNEVPSERHQANRAIADPGVVAYLGPLHSTLARFSLPVLNRAGIAQLGYSVTWPGFTRPGFAADEPAVHYPTGRRHFFRLMPPDTVQIKAAVAWADRQGIETVFLIDNGLEHGLGVSQVFAAEAFDLDVTILRRESMPLGASPETLDQIAGRVRDSQPDLVFFGGGVETGGGAMLCAIRKQRPSQRIMGTEALSIPGLSVGCPHGLLDGLLVTQPTPIESIDTPTAIKFHRAYLERYGESPGVLAANAYESTKIILDVIGASETPTRASVLDALYSQRTFDSVMGSWSFDEYGDRTPHFLALMRRGHAVWELVEILE